MAMVQFAKVVSIVLTLQLSSIYIVAQTVFIPANTSKIDFKILDSVFSNQFQNGLVIISLSEVCMISQYYAKELETIRKTWQSKGFKFGGFFPNAFSDLSSIQAFKNEFGLNFPLFSDKNGALSKVLGVVLTPEVLILDKEYQILFRGKVDDYYFAIGKHKTRTTSNDLLSAMKSIENGNRSLLKNSLPVGCLINFQLWKKTE